MIKAIAIDDEPLALKVIEHFCGQSDLVILEKSFTKTDEAAKYLRNYPVDLIFLDIQMPGKNGMEFYKALKKEVMVIFTTAHSEYAVEGFNVNAIDYLLKPFSGERFFTAVTKAKAAQTIESAGPGAHIMVRADYKLHRIDCDEILFIESLDDYIRIHIENKRPITARMSMKNVLEQLPPQNFVRIHRSYIIPVKRIKTVYNKTVTIGDFVIPVGDTYKNDFEKLL